MSDYRPWENLGKPKPEPEEVAAPSEPAGTPKETPPAKALNPPGMTDSGPVPGQSYASVKFGAGFITSFGGLLVIGAFLVMIWLTAGASAEDYFAARGEGDPRDADMVRLVRDITFWIALPLGVLFVAGGAGVYFRRPWARYMAGTCCILAGIMLLGTGFLIPVSVVAFLSAGFLLSDKSRRWHT